MTRLSFEVLRLVALLVVGAGPFLLTNPASVWLRGVFFVWMFIIACDVSAISVLWHLQCELDDEHNYPLFTVLLLPAMTMNFIVCLIVSAGIGVFLPHTPWQLIHVLAFFLVSCYLFPALYGWAVPRTSARS